MHHLVTQLATARDEIIIDVFIEAHAHVTALDEQRGGVGLNEIEAISFAAWAMLYNATWEPFHRARERQDAREWIAR